MQTNGTLLLAVELCSLACVRLAAQDGRSVPRLLYFAAVPGFRFLGLRTTVQNGRCGLFAALLIALRCAAPDADVRG